ncbi:MAG: hypothetical protein ACXVWU_01975 [Nocardioides sp.]
MAVRGMVCWDDEGGAMGSSNEERVRRLLLESFTAGWQAAQAVTITNPRVLAVIESCFELWLREAVDEVEVFGFTFRARGDMPGPRDDDDWPFPSPTEWAQGTAARTPTGHRHVREKTAPFPSQRRSSNER